MKKIALICEEKGGVLAHLTHQFILNLNPAEINLSDVYILTESLEEINIPSSFLGNLHACTFSKDSIISNSNQFSGLSSALKNQNFDEIVLIKSYFTDILATSLANDFKWPFYTNVLKIENDQLLISAFSGKALNQVISNSPNRILAIAKNYHFTEIQSEFHVRNDFNTIKLNVENECKIIHREVLNKTLSLADAEIVVGAGRGMKDPGNWGIIEDLANKLNAATACSKPVSDLNWRPHHEHVGQTGVKISPKLYIACGISGAIQHLAGVNNSGTIVVINSDPEAPFVKNADYVVIGDLFQIIPRLLKKLN